MSLGAYKIVIYSSTSVKLDSLNRKFYVDITNSLNLENPNTRKAVDPYEKNLQTEIIYYFKQITHSSWKPYEPKNLLFLYLQA